MHGAFLTPDLQYQNGKNLALPTRSFFFIEYFMKKLCLVALGFHFDIEKPEGTGQSTLYDFDSNISTTGASVVMTD